MTLCVLCLLFFPLLPLLIERILLGDVSRLVAIYGGNPEDWYKITSIQAFVINGASVQVHWFENAETLQQVELKFKRQYPKIAPQNL